MINKPITLSDKQESELESRAEKAGYSDKWEYLNRHLDIWLRPQTPLDEIMSQALTKEINDSKRWEHTEK